MRLKGIVAASTSDFASELEESGDFAGSWAFEHVADAKSAPEVRTACALDTVDLADAHMSAAVREIVEPRCVACEVHCATVLAVDQEVDRAEDPRGRMRLGN